MAKDLSTASGQMGLEARWEEEEEAYSLDTGVSSGMPAPALELGELPATVGRGRSAVRPEGGGEIEGAGLVKEDPAPGSAFLPCHTHAMGLIPIMMKSYYCMVALDILLTWLGALLLLADSHILPNLRERPWKWIIPLGDPHRRI